MYNNNLTENWTKSKRYIQKLKDKIFSGELFGTENRKRMVDFLNRYSLLFHALLACGICFLIEWISRHSFADAFTFVFDRSLVYLYNSLIVFASLMLVYLFRRRVLARMAISVFWLFLGTVNGCVLLKRVTPFSYTDLKMVGDLLTMRENYFNLAEEILIVLSVLAVVSLLGYVWWKGPKFQGKTHRLFSMFFIGVLAFFIPMVTNAAVSNDVLADYFENIAQGYSDYGFVYSFSASVVDRGMSQPDDYNAETIDTIAKDLTPAVSETAAQDMPNVICVLLESFVDPYEFNFLQYDKDPVPNFHSLYDQYTSGHLQVPVVGAGTANTEFEILTGMGMQFFGLGEYPYKTILKTTSCESVAGVFHNHGYGTHVVHNNGGNFYSRANAFSQMGFDTFTSKEMINIQDWTPLGTWPTDHCLVEEVEKTLDLTPDAPDFTYTITVQGHGTYPTEPILENPEIRVSGAMTEEDNYAWEYYVNMQHDVDTFIGDLINMLSQRDEKTVVILFGDHLPTMGLTEENMVTGSLFETKYVTWNNFGMEDASRDLTAFQLMPYMMDQLGIHDGTMVSYHQSRNYQMSEEYEHDMELLQYDLLYGDRYIYGGLDLYPASELVMGVEDITVDSFMSDEEYLSVFGSNFTPWSRVMVNGKMVTTSFINDRQLQIEASELSEGENTIQVNQMGSSNTVFRSSNEAIYKKVSSEDDDMVD